jgi:hypothetical protein
MTAHVQSRSISVIRLATMLSATSTLSLQVAKKKNGKNPNSCAETLFVFSRERICRLMMIPFSEGHFCSPSAMLVYICK